LILSFVWFTSNTKSFSFSATTMSKIIK
jgi:hypothetical protein